MKKKKTPSKPEENYPVDEELPEGWKSVVLEDHIYIAARIGWRGLKREEYTKEGPLFLAVKDIQENGFIDFQNVTDHLSEYRYDESPEIQLKEEDIIITKDGTIGKIGFVKDLPGKVTVNSSLLVVRPSSEILPRFLFFYFRSAGFQKIVRERITGSAVPHLFQKDIKKFRILVPPLAEQQRIVARVEALLSHVNAARERVSRVPLIMKKFRQAVLAAACEGRLTEGWRERNPNVESANALISEILEKRKQWYDSEFNKAKLQGRKKPKKLKFVRNETPSEGLNLDSPDSWDICFFEDIAANTENAIKAGPFGSSLTKACYEKSGYKIYGQEQVIKGDPTYGDYWISEEKFHELESCKVSPGDILISLVGTVGKVLILPDNCKPGIINPRLVKFSLIKKFQNNM